MYLFSDVVMGIGVKVKQLCKKKLKIFVSWPLAIYFCRFCVCCQNVLKYKEVK